MDIDIQAVESKLSDVTGKNLIKKIKKIVKVLLMKTVVYSYSNSKIASAKLL